MKKIIFIVCIAVLIVVMFSSCFSTNTEPEPEVITQVEYIPSELECGLELEYVGLFEYTGYCSCSNCCGEYAYSRPTVRGKEVVITASGAYASEYTIAVDPDVIPLGSLVYLEGYGLKIAQDVGGAIKGNRIDIYMENHDDAYAVGRQGGKKVWVLN